MKYWPLIEKYVEKERNPRIVIEEAALELDELSNGKAYAKLIEYTKGNLFSANLVPIFYPEEQLKETGDITFYGKENLEFLIHSNVAENYQYRVFTIEIKTDYYPFKLRLDPDIYEEIKKELSLKEDMLITIRNSEDLEKTLVKIFQSSKIKFIVGRLMALEKENITEIEEKNAINSLYEIFIAYAADEKGVDKLSKYADIHFFDNNLWFTENLMSQFYKTSKAIISRKIKNIFDCNELDRDLTVKDFFVLIDNMERKVKYYNFPMIISLGFRINNEKAIKLRQWTSNFVSGQITQNWITKIEHQKELSNNQFLLQAVNYIKGNME